MANAHHYWSAMPRSKTDVSRPADTKYRLIRAAEQLFAENGLGAVSVRDITRAAGARNESALHYHFGSKEALISAVFADRIHAIDLARRARLEALDRENRDGDLAALMAAALAPMLEACSERGGRLYATFLMQLTADPRFDVDRLMEDLAPGSVEAVRRRAAAILRDLPSGVRDTRLRRLMTLSIAVMADYARDVELGSAPPLGEAIAEAGASLAGYLMAPAASAHR